MSKVSKKDNSKKAKITIKDLINYITSSGPVPDNFLSSEKELKRQVIYLFEFFWNFPKIIAFLNQYNLLYNNPVEKDPIGFLNYLKMIIIDNKLSKFDLKSDFFNFLQELNKIKELEEQAKKEKIQLKDLIARLKVAAIKNENIKFFKNEKSSKKEFSEIESKYKELKEKEVQKRKNQNIQSIKLNEINEDIINELELTIFDIFSDEKHNQLIYIFIDKNSKKRYYIEPFYFEFFISKKSGIINNDYLEDYNENDFIKYKITNYFDYYQLKRALKNNYENFFKKFD